MIAVADVEQVPPEGVPDEWGSAVETQKGAAVAQSAFVMTTLPVSL